jgi:DNA-binding CsgD family transcriptional regulator
MSMHNKGTFIKKRDKIMNSSEICQYLAERIRIVSAIDNLDELFNNINETATALGFKYWHCVPVAPIGPNLYKFGVGSYPHEFQKSYMEKGLKGSDPVSTYALTAKKPFLIRDIVHRFNENNQEQLDLARNIGIRDGIAIPIHGQRGYIGGFVWTKSELVSFEEQETKILRLYSIIAHDMLENFLGDEFRFYEQMVKISPRAREVMEWVACGKSNFEIGKILGVSENTVKFHVKKVCEELGVNSRIQAALKCLYNYGK